MHLGKVGGTAISSVDVLLPHRLGDCGQQLVDQPRHALAHRMERRRPAEAEQVADAPVEPVDLLDDGVEVLAWPTGESGWRRTSWAAARRLASGFRSPCATAADISPIDAELLGLHQLRSRDSRAAARSSARARGPRSPISSREVGLDRVVEIAAADDGHRVRQLADRAGEAPRDEPARRRSPRRARAR